MIHPLLNPNATHYENEGDFPDIYEIEKKMTVCHGIGWCIGNINKYSRRKNKKGQHDADLIKIKDFKRYKEFLVGVPASMKDKRIREVIDKHYKEIRYTSESINKDNT